MTKSPMRYMLGSSVMALIVAAGGAMAQDQTQQTRQNQGSGQTEQASSQSQAAENACDDLQQLLENEGGEAQIDLQRLRNLVEGGSDQRCQIVLEEVEMTGGLSELAEDEQRYEETVSLAEQIDTDVDARREVSATAEETETIELERRTIVEGEVVVGVPQPDVQVRQGAPEIDVISQPSDVNVRQGQPGITVRQPQQTITMEMPAPTITIDQPAPEIIITMPDPGVDITQTEPQVEVVMSEPEVQVQQADPQIAMDLGARILSPEEAQQVEDEVASGEREPVRTRTEREPEEANVSIESQTATVSQSRTGEANVNIERADEPVVTYESREPDLRFSQMGEPNVEVRQSGEPNVTFQRAEARQADGQSQQDGEQEQTAEGDTTGDQQTGTEDGEQMAGSGETGTQTGTEDGEGVEMTEDAPQEPDTTMQGGDEMAGSDAAQDGTQQSDDVDELLGRADGATTPEFDMTEVAVSDLIGMEVSNFNGEDLGDVNRIAENNGVTYVVIEHGGFLGLGQNEYALPVARILMGENGLVMEGLTEDELESMPEYDRGVETELDSGEQIQIRAESS